MSHDLMPCGHAGTGYCMKCVRQLCADINSYKDTTITNVLKRAESAERRLAAAEANAKRYRWLRDIGDETWKPFIKRGAIVPTEVDAAIDIGLSKIKGTENEAL